MAKMSTDDLLEQFMKVSRRAQRLVLMVARIQEVASGATADSFRRTWPDGRRSDS